MKLLTKLFWFTLGALGGMRWCPGKFLFWGGRYGRGVWIDMTQDNVNLILGHGHDGPKISTPYSFYILRAYMKNPDRVFYSAFPGNTVEGIPGEAFSIKSHNPVYNHSWKGVIDTWWRMWKILP